MKIKNTSKALKPKHFYITFAVSLVICLALRFYHSMKLIDTETGFYSPSNFTVTVFYVVLAIAGIFMLIGSFLSANNESFEPENVVGKNRHLGIISIFLSVGFIMEFAQSAVNALYANRQSYYGYAETSGMAQLMKNGYVPNLLTSLFALLSALYFIKFAINCFKKNCKISKSKIFVLAPVIWGLMKLISFFVKQISFIRVSDLFLEIASISLALIFLFSFAQCISGVYSDVAQWRITGVGLPAALFLLTLNIPKFVLTLIDSERYIVSGYPVNYAELFLGIFILALVFSLGRKPKTAEPKEVVESADEETNQEVNNEIADENASNEK